MCRLQASFSLFSAIHAYKVQEICVFAAILVDLKFCRHAPSNRACLNATHEQRKVLWIDVLAFASQRFTHLFVVIVYSGPGDEKVVKYRGLGFLTKM